MAVEVVQTCAQVFNDWEAEFVAYDPKRLIGVSVIPMHDVDWAVKEPERTLRTGLVGPMINCQAPEGCPPYRDPVYDRIWAVAEEAGAPVTLHILTGRVLSPLTQTDTQTPLERGANPHRMLELFGEIQTVLANDFIFGGILDRFPQLNVVSSEFELMDPALHVARRRTPGPLWIWPAYASARAEDEGERLHEDAHLPWANR